MGKFYSYNVVDCSNKLRSILVAIFVSSITAILTQVVYSPIQTVGQEEDREPIIPRATCIYKDHEYPLTPHIFNDGEKSFRIAFPHLPDNYLPEMTMVQGEKLTMEFDGNKQPTEIQVF